MRIGELSTLAGVPTKTIRYYEEIGILPPAERAENGYRTYRPEDAGRLGFIKDAQATGLTLDEIAEILDLRERGESTCEHVIHMTRHHLADIDARIAALRKTRRELVALVERARSLDPAECTDTDRCQTIPQSGRGRARIHEAPLPKARHH